MEAGDSSFSSPADFRFVDKLDDEADVADCDWLERDVRNELMIALTVLLT